jgi:quercetin dioxygenase-like cupin family protein
MAIGIEDKPGVQVFKLKEAALGDKPFHFDCGHLKRLIPEGFPLHVAVHMIGPVTTSPEPYVELHTHDDAEVNILITTGEELIYRVQTDAREFNVAAPACIWVPAEVEHAAWAIRGSGIFMCFHLPGK